MKSKEEQLLEEIERLRQENDSLRGGGKAKVEKRKVRITAGKFHGFRTFKFEGSFRTFSIGARKVALVLQAARELDPYLVDERPRVASYSYEISEGDISFDKQKRGESEDGDDSGQI